MRSLFLLAFISFACEHNFQKQEMCSIQGFSLLKSKEISCNKPLKLSDVEFSNGYTYTLIQGAVNLNKHDYIFSILTDSTEVIEHKFPLREFDSSNYTCSIKFLEPRVVEIEWINSDRRLYLKKSLP